MDRQPHQTYDGQDIVLGKTYYCDWGGDKIMPCTPTPTLVNNQYIAHVFEDKGIDRKTNWKVKMVIQNPSYERHDSVRAQYMLVHDLDTESVHAMPSTVLEARMRKHQKIIADIENEMKAPKVG